MGIITLADLRTYVGLDDTIDDPTLTFAMNAANQKVVEHCGRTFDKTAILSASPLVYRASRYGAIDVDDFWETTALVVKTDDGDDGTYGTTWTVNTDFILEPENGKRHGQTWPYTRICAINRWLPTATRRPGVQVTAAWGWTAIPPSVFDATLIEAAAIWKRKESIEGVHGGFGDFGAVRVSRFADPDAMELLGPFVHPNRAAMVG